MDFPGVRDVAVDSTDVRAVNGEAFGHKCFGCGHEIGDFEKHIHVGLDEWSASKELDGDFGLDDILTFPFCASCTVASDRGWTPEAHEITAEPE